MPETSTPSPLFSCADSDNEAKSGVKAQAERLYGRQRSHPLRLRQQRLLQEALPRFSLVDPHHALADFQEKFSQLFLEIGFGGGEHTLDQATRHPDTAYIASEVFENGICSLLSRIIPEGEESTTPPPPNLRLWAQDARLLLKALPDRSLDRAYLMFPDPWPKARHAKRRFIHPHNISQMARLLKPGAVWRVASDHPIYQDWVTTMMQEQNFFEAPPPAMERPADWSPTRYEAKASREGRRPFYWNFVRKT